MLVQPPHTSAHLPSPPYISLYLPAGIELSSLAAFQKLERRHVKQGIVNPAAQLLTELPALQHEAVLLMLCLPLTESQVWWNTQGWV